MGSEILNPLNTTPIYPLPLWSPILPSLCPIRPTLYPSRVVPKASERSVPLTARERTDHAVARYSCIPRELFTLRLTLRGFPLRQMYAGEGRNQWLEQKPWRSVLAGDAKKKRKATGNAIRTLGFHRLSMCQDLEERFGMPRHATPQSRIPPGCIQTLF